MKKNTGVIFLVVIIFSLGLTACGPSSGPFGEYYVSPAGSDRSGDGSEARPWRTVQYALDNVDYSGEDPPRLNLARGIYREQLHITRSIVIRGVGVADAFPTSSDPDQPTENVSAIWSSIDIREEASHRIQGAISVEFQDLVFHNPRIEIDGASTDFQHVELQEVRYAHAVDIHNSPLTTVQDSKIFTPDAVSSDIGISIENSTVVIRNTEIGRHFDHVVDIGTNNVVTIEDSTIWGSDLGLADGIRIRDINEVNILNNRILRDHPDARPAVGSPAAIEIGGWTTSRPSLVTIIGNELRGFNVGIEIVSEGNRVMIQGNFIDANTHPVSTHHHGYSGTTHPTVDLGGGSLGSAGGNVISGTGPFGFYHRGPWRVTACDNDWSVPASEIPDRIHDRHDDPDLGLVAFEVCELPRQVGDPLREVRGDSPPPTVVDPSPTPLLPTVNEDTLCWKGPGPEYETVSSLKAGTVVDILGRDASEKWWIINNPRYEGVRCWTPEGDIDVDPSYEFPDKVFKIPVLPTKTPKKIQGCLWYDQNQAEVCYPIDQCPVEFEKSLGACTP